MHIAIPKPDWRIVGGFELLLARLAEGFELRGHRVTWMPVDVLSASRTPFGIPVSPKTWASAPEYFRYLSLVDTFRAMEFPSDTDIVLSTQPPSFAAVHDVHVSLFFHHLRIFYDLSDVFLEAGYGDAELHVRAAEAIKAVDHRALHRLRHFMIASQEVGERLRSYSGVTAPMSDFRPPPITCEDGGVLQPPNDDPVALCVSRHEFPKRTELFVQAMHLAASARGVMIGTGGRERFARVLDARFAQGELDPATAEAHEVWLNTGDEGMRRPKAGIVRFAGGVTEAQLKASYRAATCVVAPAYREDYGLTALEAMTFGKPVVVCNDGGGLVELVEDGVTGFVVEPTGAAIAKAVDRLCEDQELLRHMSEAARERASEYTWDRAIDAVLAVLELELSR